jgi:DNA-binding MarR family transcriptional regulator
MHEKEATLRKSLSSGRMTTSLKYDYNLSGPQAELLYFLHGKETMCVRDVACIMNTTSGAATQLIEGLVKEGIVERHARGGDRRYVHISLTDNGRAFFKDFQCKHLAHLACMLEVLSDADIVSINQARAKIIARNSSQDDFSSIRP